MLTPPNPSPQLLRAALLPLCALACSPALAGPLAPASCSATSPAVPPTVLELYTSEGCSSCPPADRWLSTFKGRSDVLALAFHVTYWDRLGWPDRFALPEGTARQRQLAQAAGSRQIYTPQVLANGKDWPQWHKEALPQASAPRPALRLALRRQGEQVHAEVSSATAAGARFSGYWAVLEDGHQSKVRAGENANETLRHDHVVRQYTPVPSWPAAQGLKTQTSISAAQASTSHPRRYVFVVTDADTLRPLQAVVLAC